MADAFAPGLAVEADTEIERLRELPLPGRVCYRIGDQVAADAVVLEADLPGDLFILRVAEQLGIDADEVMQSLKIQAGQSVQEGQLLCEHRGLFGFLTSRFVSPASGMVEFIADRTGHIGLRMPSRPLAVHAHVAGQIVAIEERKSVTLRTRAAFVQGIFGVGGERRGIVQPLAIGPAERITPASIPADAKGKVLVGGTRPSAEALAHAGSLGVAGMICGSLDDQALRDYLGYDLGIALTGDEEVPTTLIATEGFGELSLSSHVWELLKGFAGKLASINGATQVRAGAVRPEIIIAHPPQQLAAGAAAGIPAKGRGLVVGAKVRLIRVPYFGRYAEVTELPAKPEPLETGTLARVLRAKLESGETVTVPRANVELL